MTVRNIAILTSENSWFVPYAKKLVSLLKKKSYESSLYYDYKDIKRAYDVVFILSYFRVIENKFLRFLKNFDNIVPKDQKGKETYYSKRGVQDSKLDINKTIREQFNLLRIVDNQKFPAFFYYKNYKYILKIYKKNRDDQFQKK